MTFPLKACRIHGVNEATKDDLVYARDGVTEKTWTDHRLRLVKDAPPCSTVRKWKRLEHGRVTYHALYTKLREKLYNAGGRLYNEGRCLLGTPNSRSGGPMWDERAISESEQIHSGGSAVGIAMIEVVVEDFASRTLKMCGCTAGP